MYSICVILGRSKISARTSKLFDYICKYTHTHTLALTKLIVFSMQTELVVSKCTKFSVFKVECVFFNYIFLNYMPNADPLSLFQIINSATNDGSHICYKEN